MVYLLSALPCEDCLSFLLKTATQANVLLIANLTGARPHLFLARCGAKSSGQLSLTTGPTTRTLSAAWEHQELGELAVVGPPVETRPVRLEVATLSWRLLQAAKASVWLGESSAAAVPWAAQRTVLEELHQCKCPGDQVMSERDLHLGELEGLPALKMKLDISFEVCTALRPPCSAGTAPPHVLVVEVNGPQHYRRCFMEPSLSRFGEQLVRDLVKELALAKSLGVAVLIVSQEWATRHPEALTMALREYTARLCVLGSSAMQCTTCHLAAVSRAVGHTCSSGSLGHPTHCS